MEAVNRGLGASEARGDLARRHADDMAEHHDLALVVGQGTDGLTKGERLAGVAPVDAVLAIADLVAQHRPALPHVIQRHVTGDSQDPGQEGRLPLLILRKNTKQLGEDLLRHVLSLVLVSDDAPDIPVDVVRVADI
jgi:hypothetical protein